MKENSRYKEELIGKIIRVKKADNKSIEGKTGKIADETKHTLVIDTTSKRLTIIKKGSVFEVTNKEKTHELIGDHLISRPEERIKKKIPKRIQKIK